MKNYNRGIKPPYSGWFNNSFFKEGMGCPIRSEIWGFVFPGAPIPAAEYARLDGELDHADNSVWAEQFLAAVESMLFIEDDIEKLIDLGLSYIPQDCKLAKCMRMVVEYYKSNNSDWIGARRKVVNLFGHPDFTNVAQNLGLVVIAMLYGGGDLRKTIDIALQCGYDTDCTCATAGTIIGGILGYSGIETQLKGLINDYFVCGIDVKRRSDSIRDLAEDTCRVGVSLSAIGYGELGITDIPLNTDVYKWVEPDRKFGLEIGYKDMSAVGYADSTAFEIKVSNRSDRELYGTVVLENVPKGWIIGTEKWNVHATPGETLILPDTVSTSERTEIINNTNIIKARLLDERGRAAGCGNIKRIDIVRNNKDIYSICPDGQYIEFVFEDTEPIEEILQGGNTATVYYYVRLMQDNDHQAWASPIWFNRSV